jgi:hypothetical protein
VSLFQWMKGGLEQRKSRVSTDTQTQTPCFEQLEPRVLLSADALMSPDSPLMETPYESAIVVEYESGTDSELRTQNLELSDSEASEELEDKKVGIEEDQTQDSETEERSDGLTVGQSDSQSTRLSVSELTTAASLSATVQNEILPSQADASEDSTLLHTSNFTLQTSVLGPAQNRGPPADGALIDSSAVVNNCLSR